MQSLSGLFTARAPAGTGVTSCGREAGAGAGPGAGAGKQNEQEQEQEQGDKIHILVILRIQELVIQRVESVLGKPSYTKATQIKYIMSSKRAVEKVIESK